MNRLQAAVDMVPSSLVCAVSASRGRGRGPRRFRGSRLGAARLGSPGRLTPRPAARFQLFGTLLALLSLFVLAGCGPSEDDIVRNLQSGNPVVREDTAKLARNVGGDEVVKALIGVLDDPSEAVRVNAVDSLAELGDASAVEPLIEVLRNDSSALVKREAVEALGRIGDPRAVPALIDYIEQHLAQKGGTAPLNAIWALGNIGDARALPLLSKLHDDQDIYVSWNATVALRALKPPGEASSAGGSGEAGPKVPAARGGGAG